MSSTVADITTFKKDQENSEKVSLSITLPAELYERVKLDSTLSRKPVGAMVEEWADQYVSLQDVSIGLATVMKTGVTREKQEADVTYKSISVPVSRRHYNLIRMESMRQCSTIRAIVRGWMQENVKDWYVEPMEENRLDTAA